MFRYIYIYIFAEKQIIEAHFYAMFYILLNSCQVDLYVPFERQMQQGLQQTWTLKSDFPRNFQPKFSRCDIVCLAWAQHPYGQCSLC